MAQSPTCAIRHPTDVGGQHLDCGQRVGVLLQPILELKPHLAPNARQLLLGQPEQSQHRVNLLPLGLQAGGHRGHHGGALGAAALRQEEADVTVRDQFPHHLVQAFWVPEGRGDGKICKNHKGPGPANRNRYRWSSGTASWGALLGQGSPL